MTHGSGKPIFTVFDPLLHVASPAVKVKILPPHKRCGPKGLVEKASLVSHNEDTYFADLAAFQKNAVQKAFSLEFTDDLVSVEPLKSSDPYDQALEAFRKQWLKSINGIGNSWKMPIIGIPTHDEVTLSFGYTPPHELKFFKADIHLDPVPEDDGGLSEDEWEALRLYAETWLQESARRLDLESKHQQLEDQFYEIRANAAFAEAQAKG